MKLARIKTFLTVNPGTVFIIFFAALVFTCAYLVILEGSNDPVIDYAAVLAYSSLLVGIVLQAVGSIRARALGARL